MENFWKEIAKIAHFPDPTHVSRSLGTTEVDGSIDGKASWSQIDPDAGTILFELATNFLLYTALVLITYLVVKLYIESSPENPLFEEDRHNSSSNELSIELRNIKMEDGPNPMESRRSIHDFFEIKREELPSKSTVMKKLILLSIGLNVTFVSWGVIQERILKMEYGEGKYFTYSYGLVFTNRFLGLIFSGCLLYFTKPTWSKALAYEYALPSVTNMLSSWCQYEALKFVTFPTQVLSKSFKTAPIMVMGRLLGNKTYPFYDYVVAATIGLGVAIFVSSSEGLKIGVDTFGNQGAIGCGLLLLGLYLIIDSFTSQWQSRMFTVHKDLSPIQMMFIMNAFSTVFSMVTLVHEGDLVPFFRFVQDNPEIHLHFIAFSLLATIGQLLIFHTIRNFGAVVFAIIMTVRIALSILMSCFIYDHPITEMGILGLVIVFCAVGYRVQRKIQGERLLKWKGIEDDKAQDVINEWHEHLDF